MSDRALNGFLNVNKPSEITSHDVVAAIRRCLRPIQRDVKVGHAGTLDPLATGVLVICVGAAARLSEYVMQSAKEYVAEIIFGVSTSTYDAHGEITSQQNASHLTLSMICEALPAFMGNILQVPPMHSAIKQQGKKLYELARRGEMVERQARPVKIDKLEIINWDAPVLSLRIVCGPGTYIRSLAHDLGQSLGVGAHLRALTRTRSGAFTLDRAKALESLLDSTILPESLIPVRDALPDWPTLTLSAQDQEHIVHGRAIQRQDEQGDNLALAFDAQSGKLIALLRADQQLWRPAKVFTHS